MIAIDKTAGSPGYDAEQVKKAITALSAALETVSHSKRRRPARISAYSGTAQELKNNLAQEQEATSVVVITIADASKQYAVSIAEALRAFAPLVQEISESRRLEKLEVLIEALMPDVKPPRHMLREARMEAQARAAVLNASEWLTAQEISQLAGFSMKNPSAQPNKWKREGKIFAVEHEGADFYPGYALDPDNGYRPYPVIGQVLEAFQGQKSAWGLAFWFASLNSYLGARRPFDLIRSEPELLVAAAEDELIGARHG